MKFAQVQYTGPMRTHNRKGESGEMYHFNSPTGGGVSNEVPVSVLEDAYEFAEQDVYDVEWTAQGEVARRVGRQASSARDALTELSYRQKQRLTSALGLDVQGNSKEDELDEALEPAVEKMIEGLNNQR